MRFLVILLTVFSILILAGCSTVKPWQRVYLNDPEMQMTHSPGETFGDYVHSIRTGSLSAGSYKSAGGCGCN